MMKTEGINIKHKSLIHLLKKNDQNFVYINIHIENQLIKKY